MPTSKTSPYDVLIVGAGINGCSCAWFLNRAGLRVALIDRSGIAQGGSGAAGAFISPKFSKSGPLKEIVAAAHAEALDFYSQHFPQQTLVRPLLHIANSASESEKLAAYKSTTALSFTEVPDALRRMVVPEALENEAIYLERGAVVDAQGVCRAMAEGSDFYSLEASDPVYQDGLWHIGELRGVHMILSTGAYPKILGGDSIKLRGIWGHRIDVQTDTEVPCILHHHVSISPTLSSETVAIGATHDVHFDPFGKETYDIEAGRAALMEKAARTLKLDNVRVVRDYTGLRSGTHDYYPIAGELVDESSSVCEKSGEKPNVQTCVFYPNVWMINGSGGYGFVLAPYLARRICEHIVSGREIDPSLSPARFFLRRMKRQS
ncbi:FAD-binding oxidoreductase [Sulfuricurvum sp. IAE1]|uniref:NAD(P)/FAD-dependent oxidoreductase n=1 Tax=Sulfuricurvum sp. IAE1 TaxID=2546102 RepID=UPI00104AF876|nr:FAD-binding oxidoreductase [Sulfuricurvum sp. IAE1]TDA63171.1 FAD-binding oxidoreductase [Sulfuricurvum sp. IAE1]